MGYLNDNAAIMQTVPEDDLGYWSYGGLPQAGPQGGAAMIQPPPQPAAPPQQNPRAIDGLLSALAQQMQRQPAQPQGMQPQQQAFSHGGQYLDDLPGYGIGGFLKKVGKGLKGVFDASLDMPKAVLKDPKRLLTGVDPVSTKLWNMTGITNDKPLVNLFGGPTQESLDRHNVNEYGRLGVKLADTIAGSYATAGLGNLGGGLLGKAGGELAGEAAMNAGQRINSEFDRDYYDNLARMGYDPEGFAQGGDVGAEEMYADEMPLMFAGAGGVSGPGTGRSDHVNARLSDGEYVMDAETVALLGDGSNKAGAQRLDDLRRRIRAHKGRLLAQGKFSNDAKAPEAYLRGGR